MAMSLSDYRDALRSFIKDHSTKNRLLNFIQENSDSELDLYLNMSLGFLNSMPPLIGSYTMETFPIPLVIVHQAAIECLISNGIVNSRNDLTYNNGGLTVRISDGDKYLRHLEWLSRIVDQGISQFIKIKIALNIQSGYGGVSSPYSYLHGNFGTLQPNTILS